MFNDKNCFYSGIHEYDNITKLLEDFKNIFVRNAAINGLIPFDYNPSNIKIYKYTVPKMHINGYEMRKHINGSERLSINVSCFMLHNKGNTIPYYGEDFSGYATSHAHGCVFQY